MKQLLMIFGLLFLLVGCDSDEDGNSTTQQLNNSTTATETPNDEGDLTEFGTVQFEQDEDLSEGEGSSGEESSTSSSISIDNYSNVCEAFEIPEANLGSHLQGSFSRIYNECDELGPKVQTAFLLAADFAHGLVENFGIDMSDRCMDFAKRAMKKIYQMKRRNQKIETGHANSFVLALRNEMTKHHLDIILRKAIRKECHSSSLASMSYSHGDDTELYTMDDSFIINGSFELMSYEGEHGYVQLKEEDNWTIVDASNMPGWRVNLVGEEDSSKKCDYIEVQESGTVTSAPEGNQIVELDGHCTSTASGSRTSGDSHIEVYQRFVINEAGSYKLSFKAQKRSGQYGDLGYSIFQRPNEAQVESYTLPDSATWTEVCIDYEVLQDNQFHTVAIRDQGTDGRKTFGLLIDDVKFSSGSCD